MCEPYVRGMSIPSRAAVAAAALLLACDPTPPPTSPDAVADVVDDVTPDAAGAVAGRWDGDPCLLHCNYEAACHADRCGVNLLEARAACIATCDPGETPEETNCYLLTKAWCERSPESRAGCLCPIVQTLCGRAEMVDITWTDCASPNAGGCDIDLLVLSGDGTFALSWTDELAPCLSGTWSAWCSAHTAQWSAGSLTLEPRYGKSLYLDLEMQVVGDLPSSLQLDDMLLAPRFVQDDPFVAAGCEALGD